MPSVWSVCCVLPTTWWNNKDSPVGEYWTSLDNMIYNQLSTSQVVQQALTILQSIFRNARLPCSLQKREIFRGQSSRQVRAIKLVDYLIS